MIVVTYEDRPLAVCNSIAEFEAFRQKQIKLQEQYEEQHLSFLRNTPSPVWDPLETEAYDIALVEWYRKRDKALNTRFYFANKLDFYSVTPLEGLEF